MPHWETEPVSAACQHDALQTELQPRPKFKIQDTPAYDEVPSNSVWLQMPQPFRRYRNGEKKEKKKSFFIIQALTVTLTLKLANQSFPMTL